MKKDTTIKEIIKNITRDISKYILKLDINGDIKFIDSELSRIEIREADIVVECKLKDEDIILHLEIQSSYDAKMARRMLRYYSDIKMIYPQKKIYQYLIYIGENQRNMKSNIEDINLNYKFKLINMKDINCEELIKMDTPEALVLAILCDFKDKDKLETIKNMLKKLETYTKDDTKRYANYLLSMEVLTENLKIQNILKEAEKMLREVTVEKLSSYQIGKEQGIEQGMQKGMQKGIQQGAINIAKTSLKQGLDINTISKITGLSIKEIEKLIKR